MIKLYKYSWNLDKWKFLQSLSGLSFMGWELASYGPKKAKEAGELNMDPAAGFRWLPVLSCVIQVLFAFLVHAAVQVREGKGWFFSSFDQAAGYLQGILDSFSDACDDQYQVAVCELVPEQMQSKRVPRKHPQSRITIFLQPLALKFPLLSGLCKSRPRRCRMYLAIFLPSPPSGCCFLSRARRSVLGSLSGQAAAARCSPALPVPKVTAALKQAHKSYVHGDTSSWASQVEHPKLIDILDWIFLCLCSLSIKW